MRALFVALCVTELSPSLSLSADLGSPLDVFKARNDLRAAGGNHLTYGTMGVAKLSVSPFGYEDTTNWWTLAAAALNSNNISTLPSILPSIKIHSTKISIAVEPLSNTHHQQNIQQNINLCLYNSELIEIVCTEVSAEECAAPFTVNLGPEAGGHYLLVAGGVDFAAPLEHAADALEPAHSSDALQD